MKKIAKIVLLLQVLFQCYTSAAEITTTKFPDKVELVALLPTATINNGNKSRIISVMKRALEGNELTIAAIGGSITAGANATNFPKTSYSPIVYDWWVSKFPNANINYINAYHK